MHEPDDTPRLAPFFPGAVLTALFALLGSCDAPRGVTAHTLSGLVVLEAPWFFVALCTLTRSSLPPALGWIGAVAIIGGVVRLTVPRRWTVPVGVIAGLAWALCSCATLAERV